MGTFSGIGIGLSVVFGFLLLALVGELYYLLWWKKKNSRRENETDQIITEHEYGNYVKELTELFRWKKSPSNGGEIRDNVKGEEVNGDVELDPELGSNKDLLLKALGGEEGAEAELMRLHNLAGPPRFLFTIKEESKEDLESDDGRSRKGSRTGSMMSDVVLTIDTPNNFLSPLASPMAKSPLNPLSGFQHNGFNFNPLFESSSPTEAELNRLRSSSPPPKFKFMRDAEEKLLRRLLIEETEKRVQKNSSFSTPEVNQGSFLKFIVGKNNEQLQYLPQYPSSSSQVLPLSSSPITFRPVGMNGSVH